MIRYELFERSQIDLRNLAERGHDMTVERLLPLEPPLSPFEHAEVDDLVEAIVAARQADRPVVIMMGGHPIKLGLSRFLIDLIERRLVTHLATNGAGIIHDFELAMVGGTSENVAKWIQAGQFGLWHETSRLNDVIIEAAQRDEGLGEAVGRVIEEQQFSNRQLSIAAAGYRVGVPITSHVSIGSDIIHAMRNCDGAALGKASYTDFLIFARAIQDLEGGVFLNIGSAVTGPEVYLKALSMARNVARYASESGTGTYRPDMSQSQFPSRQASESGTGTDRPDPSQSQFPSRQASESGTGTDRPDPSQSQFPSPRHFTTAVFDLVGVPHNFRDGPPGKDHPLYYYRPWKTILCRTIADGGSSYYFQGDHSQTIPTLWHKLVTNAGC